MGTEKIIVNTADCVRFNNNVDACVGTGRLGLALTDEYLKELEFVQDMIGFSYIRGHGLFCDDVAIYHEYEEDGKTRAEYNYTYIDRIFDGYLKLGIRPYLELGFMPDKMASGDQTVFYWKGNTTPPKDYKRWTDMVIALLSHLKDRYGKEVTSWPIEVWNEPNLPGFWLNADMDEYFRLFKETFTAIKKYDNSFKVGGPAICGVEDAKWIRAFLEFCKKEEIKPDYITRHHYTVEFPERVGHYDYSLLMDSEAGFENLQSTRDIVDSFEEFKDLPIHITEFNTSYTPKGVIHDTNINAAYLALQLSRLGDINELYSYWTFGDVFEEQGVPRSLFHGGFGLVAAGNIPKPTFWTFYFYKQLKLFGTDCIYRDDRSVIVKGKDGFSGILWNLSDEEESRKFKFGHVNGNEYSLVTKTVDEQCCNPLKLWHDIGEPAYPSEDEMQLIRDAAYPLTESAALVSDNGYVSAAFDIGKHGVIYFTLTKRKLTPDRGYDYDRVTGNILNVNTIRLPKLISDGMVLQRRKSIHIWGWDKAGNTVSATICEVTASAAADENGRFDIYLPARESGGPYELVIKNDHGNQKIIRDVYIGLVWFCSGQSNMELPVEMVIERYPYLKDVPDNTGIRSFKIVEDTDFNNPQEEIKSGNWSSVSAKTIRSFSATGYFFAAQLQKITGLTVGIIDATLGGSRISAWMSREMLEGYDELLAEADRYADDEFRKNVAHNNATLPQQWRDEIDKNDIGLSLNYIDPEFDDSSWKSMNLPVMFDDTDLKGFIGSVWFRKSFDLPEELAGKSSRLFIGTLVDRDEVFVNGVRIGGKEHQYLPRFYDIPEGVTRRNCNTVVIRLCVENGRGRFTPDKDYMIFNEKSCVRLEGSWKYQIGSKAGSCIPPTDFINWKSVGLYNAVTAPCHNFPIDGILWYQGESNTGDYYDYDDLCRRMVNGYRKEWGEENLPFLFVQLPNFVIDTEGVCDPWPQMRLEQKKLLDDPNVGMAVSMDVGEDNDLHPTEKEPVGRRLALCAARMRYGYTAEYTGPEAVSLRVLDSIETSDLPGRDITTIELTLTHSHGLHLKDLGKGDILRDFEVVKDDGSSKEVSASIIDEKILLQTDVKADAIKEIRYLYTYTYHGAMIYNEADIPMGPFVMKLSS